MVAVADVSKGIIHAVIDIEAPPSAVFEALTDPAQLAQWWGSPEMYRTHDWVIDLRPGGAWSCKATDARDHHKSTVSGAFVVVDPPRVLEMTWNPSWVPGPETLIRYELAATPTGTRVTLRHSGFESRPDACHGHASGWENIVVWLARYLRRG